MTRTYKMLINGKLVEGKTTFPVVNPSTGKPFADAPECTKEQMNEAIAAAKASFPKWAPLSLKERQEYMTKAAREVEKHIDELVELLVKEQGKPVSGAKFEMDHVVKWFDYYAKAEFELEKVLADNEKEKVVQKRFPLGVIGGITPWNFPPLMAAWKAAECMVLGNVMVIKPSPFTPLSTLLLGEVLANVFPAGTFNILSGSDEAGRWITEHPDISKVSFTGSVKTGKKIQCAASDTLKRVTLELGGNDPAIILEDADSKAAATGVFKQAMANTGQICIAVKRLYVHEKKYDEVVAELTQLAKKAKVGDGFEKDVEYGPLNNKMQFDRVSELVNDAKANGAEVCAGGAPLDRDGYFFPPTILTNVDDGMRIVDEEQFGPVLPVMKFKDAEDALARANATRYGLGASVWGTDEKRACDLASRLESGSVWVNHHGAVTPDVPFGGCKESGIGRQHGEGTIQNCTEVRVLRLAKKQN